MDEYGCVISFFSIKILNQANYAETFVSWFFWKVYHWHFLNIILIYLLLLLFKCIIIHIPASPTTVSTNGVQYGRVWNLFHNSHLSECEWVSEWVSEVTCGDPYLEFVLCI